MMHFLELRLTASMRGSFLLISSLRERVTMSREYREIVRGMSLREAAND